MSEEQVLAAYRAAALKFIRKVRTGRAQSVETYNDLLNAVRLHDELDGTGPEVTNHGSNTDGVEQ